MQNQNMNSASQRMRSNRDSRQLSYSHKSGDGESIQQLEQLKPLRQRGLSNSHRQAKNFSAGVSTEAKTF